MRARILATICCLLFAWPPLAQARRRAAFRLLRSGWRFYVAERDGLSIWRKNFCRNPPGSRIRRCRTAAFVPQGRLALPGSPAGLALASGLVLAARKSAGLFLVDVRDPDALRLRHRARLAGPAEDVVVSGRTAYVAAGRAGLLVLRLSRRRPPQQLARLSLPGPAQTLAHRAGRLALGLGAKGLALVDVTHPGRPRLLAHLLVGPVHDVAFLSRNRLLVSSPKGLRLLEVTHSRTLRLLGPPVAGRDGPTRLAVSGRHAAAAARNVGALLVKFRGDRIQVVARHWRDGPVHDVALRAGKGRISVFLATDSGLAASSWWPGDGEAF